MHWWQLQWRLEMYTAMFIITFVGVATWFVRQRRAAWWRHAWRCRTTADVRNYRSRCANGCILARLVRLIWNDAIKMDATRWKSHSFRADSFGWTNYEHWRNDPAVVWLQGQTPIWPPQSTLNENLSTLPHARGWRFRDLNGSRNSKYYWPLTSAARYIVPCLWWNGMNTLKYQHYCITIIILWGYTYCIERITIYCAQSAKRLNIQTIQLIKWRWQKGSILISLHPTYVQQQKSVEFNR